MLSPENNALITQVEPGAPLHPLLKQYWIPAIRSAAVVAGGAPKRVKLLGERYVVFRGDDGRVGFLDERCPHRGASLALARNEDCALRCLYHGWKIGVDGKVLEMPSEGPNTQSFAAKVRVSHFPVWEGGGLIWTWLGSGDPPAFPAFEFTRLDPEHCRVGGLPTDCNWLQAVEGNFDAAHAGVLHKTSNLQKGQFTFLTDDSAPRWHLENRAWGLTTVADRAVAGAKRYIRINEYVFPYLALVATEEGVERMAVLIVPVDDRHCIQWVVWYKPEAPIPGDSYAAWYFKGMDDDPDNGRYTIRAQDDWGQSRERMAEGSFSGLQGIAIEDLAIFESQGPVVDRSREHLGTSDQAVIRLRRVIIDAVKAHAGQGELLIDGSDGRLTELRARSFMAEADDHWEELDPLADHGGQAGRQPLTSGH
jgi:phthalate 4,5-dioxygenase oxygenase subunit